MLSNQTGERKDTLTKQITGKEEEDFMKIPKIAAGSQKPVLQTRQDVLHVFVGYCVSSDT